MDQDGQVQMSEYASSWSDDVVADFAQFDLNGDGIVTPAECLEAAERGAVQGAGRSSGGYGTRPSYASSSSDRRDSGRDRRRPRRAERGIDRHRRSSSTAAETQAATAAVAAAMPAAAGR